MISRRCNAPGRAVAGWGRVHGDGLHKVNPNEIARIPARLVLDSVKTHVRIEEQSSMFD
jgi:hypothetical protein